MQQHAISVIIPVHNSASHLEKCLRHLAESRAPIHECIVVDDGSTDNSAQVAASFGAVVLKTPQRSGPARARNLGASRATGDILFFIDADVCVHANTIERVRQAFADEPDLDCVIGSYDETPESQDFLSQYRNLMHCFVHQQGRRAACTFWSGCGAIKRSVFLKHSGFEESYNRPAIEDIELGYRLNMAGCRMMLDPSIQVKHLKRWTFLNLVKTDILDRGVPWTELILRTGQAPNDLNLQLSQRVSTALAFLVVGLTTAGAAVYGAVLLVPLLILLLLILSTYWVEVAAKPSKWGLGVLIATGGLIAFLAYLNNLSALIPPLITAFVLLFIRHRYTYGPDRETWRRYSGLTWGVFALLFVVYIITYLPRHPIIFGLFSVLLTIIILNSQFYVFLAARLGWLHALAALPFHLLYHFYNGLSFGVGFTRHWFRRLTGSASPPPWRHNFQQESPLDSEEPETPAAVGSGSEKRYSAGRS